ncbi:MAG TPA: hypothetical protein VFC25_03040 [Verrucomicrobiae bacterium]|nr:hypothetical protein [Verrucomicrobiae bacterium]
MKRTRAMVFAALLGLVLAAAGRTPAQAGQYADQLTKCLVDSTTDEDKAGLARWIFASAAQNPNVADLAAVTDEQRTEMSKSVAAIFERVLTQDCRTQFRDAKKNEGENMLSMSFGTLVQVAMGNLIDNPAVSGALGGIDKELNKQKFAEAAAEP